MDLELRKRLNRIVEILLIDSATNRAASIEQICYLIFLKIIDDEESVREYEADTIDQKELWDLNFLFLGQAKRYRWSK